MVFGFVHKKQDLERHFAMPGYQDTVLFILDPMVLMDGLNGD